MRRMFAIWLGLWIVGSAAFYFLGLERGRLQGVCGGAHALGANAPECAKVDISWMRESK